MRTSQDQNWQIFEVLFNQKLLTVLQFWVIPKADFQQNILFIFLQRNLFFQAKQ
jgi:hypothetical protein